MCAFAANCELSGFAVAAEGSISYGDIFVARCGLIILIYCLLTYIIHPRVYVQLPGLLAPEDSLSRGRILSGGIRCFAVRSPPPAGGGALSRRRGGPPPPSLNFSNKEPHCFISCGASLALLRPHVFFNFNVTPSPPPHTPVILHLKEALTIYRPDKLLLKSNAERFPYEICFLITPGWPRTSYAPDRTVKKH